MLNSIVASCALFVASVSALGSAAVVNNCPYDVSLSDVPASGGGFAESSQMLQTGETWSHQWTELTNGAGWSIKLAKQSVSSNIMQYEYTYQTATADIIWYDLSDVNGNPWNGDWEVASDLANCQPKEQAYRFATDDAYGMQVCPSDATITVTLCSGSGSSNSTAPSSPAAPSSSAAVPLSSSAAAAPSSSAAAPSPSAAAPSSSIAAPPSSAAAPESSSTTLAAASFILPAPTVIQISEVAAPSSSPSPAITSTVFANKAAAPSSSAQTVETPASPVPLSVVVVTTVQTTHVAAPTTQAIEAPASPITLATEAPASPITLATEALASTATTAAASPVWTGPWIDWGLAPNGAVEAVDGILKREATTFATLVSAAQTEAPSPTGIAGRLSRRHHEHAGRRHRHHHAA